MRRGVQWRKLCHFFFGSFIGLLEWRPVRVQVRQLGWERRQMAPREVAVLRGVEAARLLCYASARIEAMRLRIDRRTILRVPAGQTRFVAGSATRRKYVFNAWFDVSGLAAGEHEIEFYFETRHWGRRTHRRRILIDHPREAAEFRHSSVVISSSLLRPGVDPALLINAAPSVVHSARRGLFWPPPANVLVVRADQLGDFVASIPAILRLRALLPQARLSALVTPGTYALAKSLGLFEDIYQAELAYDPKTRRRSMTQAGQAALAGRLRAGGFDLAIDLHSGSDTQPLLLLTGAPHLVGFKPREFPFLTFGIETMTREPVNRNEAVSHAVCVLSLVEAFGAAMSHRPTVLPIETCQAGMTHFDLNEGDRFLLLHAGSRIATTRWPITHYLRLARLTMEQSALRVVMLADETVEQALLAESGIDLTRFHLRVGPVDFDDLEMLIACCAVFVGNDSGPKHLAAFRGAKVVSVHGGRINWEEWGQEGDGIILTRHVPCFGCGIEDPLDCGQGLSCLVNISPEEVCEAVLSML